MFAGLILFAGYTLTGLEDGDLSPDEIAQISALIMSEPTPLRDVDAKPR